MTPFHSEKWDHDHEENFTDAAVQDDKQREIEQLPSSRLAGMIMADSDRNQMDQRATPNDVCLVTCHQTVRTNPEDERTDEEGSLELQWSWGKAVSFFTNATNRLRLYSTFHSLAQIPVVANSGKVRDLSKNESNNLDNKDLISENTTNFIFFL